MNLSFYQRFWISLLIHRGSLRYGQALSRNVCMDRLIGGNYMVGYTGRITG